jgi:NAD(P)-dependent dehydrogenase (short-subunit alcohol dehydrogenase family)
VARAFAEAGCLKIAITDLNSDLLAATQVSIQGLYPDADVLYVSGDIASETFVNSLIGSVVSKFGRIDYAVNCAGIMGNNQPSGETSLEDFDKINNVNYRGLWLCSRAQIRAMLKQELLPSHDATRIGERGSIVNIASQLGIVGRPSARTSSTQFLESPLICD